MADYPDFNAALQDMVYGPNLAQTVGWEPPSYDSYMRHINAPDMFWNVPASRQVYNENLPVYPGNSYHYSPQGTQEAYQAHGIPPVMYNRGGFTGAAFRTFVNPFGQMMVQPLVGAASKYPHVLSGVPMDMNYGANWAMQDAPMYMPWLWGMGRQAPQAPQAQPALRPAASRQSGTTTNTQPPAAPRGQHWVHPTGTPAGNYTLVPDDFSQAALHPAYEGQLRANANWNTQGSAALPPAAQGPLRSVQQPNAEAPWYAPIIDDLANLGIRFPQMDYQPPVQTAPSVPVASPVQATPQSAPLQQPQAPYSYTDGSFLSRYNPTVPQTTSLPSALQPSQELMRQVPLPQFMPNYR